MDSNQPHTLCNKCNNFIKTPHFLVHNTRCRGPSTGDTNMSPSRISNSSSRSNRMNIFTKTPSEQKKSSNKKYRFSQNQSNQEQKIPCHFCGYMQSFAQLDTHPSTCQHRQQQCMRCHNSFPRTLMSQHRYVCQGNRQNNQNQQQSQQSSLHSSPNPFFRRRESNNVMPSGLMRMQRNHNPIVMMQYFFGNQSSPQSSYGTQNRPSIRNRGDREERNHHSMHRIILINDLTDLIRLLAGNIHSQQQGLSKQQIKQFPTQKFLPFQRKQDDQDMCIICYCKFQQNEEFMTLPCKHIFHPQCVSTWLEKNPTCPVCKHNFGKKQQQQQQSQSDFSEPRRGPEGLFRIFRG